MKKSTIFGIQLIVAIALLTVPAQAAPVSYSFQVTASGGPLNGVSSTGTFTFDDSIIPAGGSGNLYQSNLLTDLSFSWNGKTYDETTANTGWLGFNVGNLITFGFGTIHFDGGVGITELYECWAFYRPGTVDPVHFEYSTGNKIEYYPNGTGSYQRMATIPEPSTMLLLGGSLLGLVVLRRKLKR